MRIGVLGAGSWAIALTVLLHKRGHQVSMWEFNPQDAEMLQQKREHPVKLPGIRIPDDVDINNDIAATVKASEIIICAVPSQTMRSTMKRIAQLCTDKEISSIQGWVIVAKGIETDTLKLMTDVLLEELPRLLPISCWYYLGHPMLRRFPETFLPQSLLHLKTGNLL